MHFKIYTASEKGPTNSALIYRQEEHWFDVEPAPSDSYTSLLIDILNLELNDAGHRDRLRHWISRVGRGD